MREVKFQLRATAQEVELWRRAALERGVSVSQWIRLVLRATAEEMEKRRGVS